MRHPRARDTGLGGGENLVAGQNDVPGLSTRRRFVVVGGGAAGFFAAITAAESDPALEVVVLEKASHFLGKVRISGGGRCNVTHAEFDPRNFVQHYPRGQRELLGPLHRFQARDTVDWFASRGVALKTEADGRMFPTTDSSATIVDCLLDAARAAGVQLRAGGEVVAVARRSPDGFELQLRDGEALGCDALLLATGGTRVAAGARMASALGHTLVPPVPSLFAIHIEAEWLHALAGISVPDAEVSLPETRLRARGPLLVTHRGLSGPAILRLSAWAARELHAAGYAGELQVDFLPDVREAELADRLAQVASQNAARAVARTALAPIPARLWQALVTQAGIDAESRWASIGRKQRGALLLVLQQLSLPMAGKSANKDEFVTCGGVDLREVSFRSMESRVCPGLYFAGELLDIDALTGGFNFQSAWTTGWLVGQAVAGGATTETLGGVTQ